MTERRDRTFRSLDITALGLIGEGATRAELLGRLTDQRNVLAERDVSRALDRLVALGLVRVVSAEPQPRYALTSLGARTLDTSLGSETVASQLAELERLRSDLFSTVSHELRTPLTAIRTCVGLLLDPSTRPDSAETQQLLETIERNADRMQRLVAEVLDLARYRSGSFRLQRRRFDARELVHEVLAAVGPLASARNQAIATVAPPTPLWVYGDHRRLEQALLNLVSNAQKFSPDGSSITVEVRESEAEVQWEVVDEGPGISTEDQAHLFERFFVGTGNQGETATRVGLGLPTALAIAQAHGGGVEVMSEIGCGSRFILHVPTEPILDDEDA